MMTTLIVEDEHHAAKRLQRLLKGLRPDLKVMAHTDSVEDTVAWLHSEPEPDLIFMDIQLADGLSFRIFEQCDIQAPVIFTTAFNEYTLQAFRHNGIDYLLKPIEEAELERALVKMEKWSGPKESNLSVAVSQILQQFDSRQYPTRFLLKQRQTLSYINIEDIAYLYSENSMTFIVGRDGKKYHTEHTLEQAAALLPPLDFFRINRKMVVHLPAIQRVTPYFNHRLHVELQPAYADQAIVSRERVKEFTAWLGV